MPVTTVTKAIPAIAGSDAGLRTLLTAITEAMTEIGMTQAYTNIDLATVTYPTTYPTDIGKIVYRFSDSVSQTREVYVGIVFSRAVASGNNMFKATVTVGHAHTDGVVSGTSMTNAVGWGSTTDSGEIIAVRTPNGFTLFSNFPTAATQFGIFVERLARAGVGTPDGAVCGLAGSVDTTSYTTTPLIRLAHYGLNIVYSAQGGKSLSSEWLKQPVGCIGLGTEPTYQSKTSIVQFGTTADYDPIASAIVVPNPPWTGGAIFDATVNGVAGTYRVLYGNASYCDVVSSGGMLRLAYRIA